MGRQRIVPFWELGRQSDPSQFSGEAGKSLGLRAVRAVSFLASVVLLPDRGSRIALDLSLVV